jgi:hypothetical protein
VYIYIVKKYIIIFLLCSYLFSVTQFNELLKLPKLVEHFIAHSQQNKVLSFSDFMSMHYAFEDIFDSDYDQDMKLPFKSNTCVICFSAVYLCAPIPNFNFIAKRDAKEYKRPNFNYTFSFISNFHCSIWQPPKIC